MGLRRKISIDYFHPFKIGSKILSFCVKISMLLGFISNWKTPSLNTFIDSLTKEKENLVRTGSIKNSKIKDHALIAQWRKNENPKEKQKVKEKNPKSDDEDDSNSTDEGSNSMKKSKKKGSSKCSYYSKCFHSNKLFQEENGHHG